MLRARALSEDGNVIIRDTSQPMKFDDLARQPIELSHIGSGYTGLREVGKLHERLLIGAEGDKCFGHPLVSRALADLSSPDSVRAHDFGSRNLGRLLAVEDWSRRSGPMLAGIEKG